MNSILANTKSNVYTNVSVYGIQGLVYHCKDINHMVSISTDRNKWICSIDRRNGNLVMFQADELLKKVIHLSEYQSRLLSDIYLTYNIMLV